MKQRRGSPTNFAALLRSGGHYGVFIDDTGSPGQIAGHLHPQRKSWAAVVATPEQVHTLIDALPAALTALSRLGLREPEFHFTEILGGNGAFAESSLEFRLDIFREMSSLFCDLDLAVLVQTLDPISGARIRADHALPEKVGPLRSKTDGDLALILLLGRVRRHLRTLFGDDSRTCVIVDEGRLKAGSNFSLSSWAPLFEKGAVLFESSKTVHLLQLADFAAFCMNRVQLLTTRAELSPLDRQFLEIVSPMSKCYRNLEQVQVVAWQQAKSLRDGMH